MQIALAVNGVPMQVKALAKSAAPSSLCFFSAGDLRRYMQKEHSMKHYLAGVVTLIVSMSAHAEVVIDVPKIAGKSESTVAKYLGKPTSFSNSKYGKKCQYAKGETEVVFIGGKADWITVEGMDHIPFTKSALSAIGLTEAPFGYSLCFPFGAQALAG